ncbi:MAG: palindromic element RPE1 domain-containing protein [Holosporales bacterium]|nr:palindromic element RPE1 domain-containing protein [Holosporales bacterium]
MGPLSKPSKSEFWEGETECRSAAYLLVREHSSTGSTSPKTDFEEFRKRSIEYFSGETECRSAAYLLVREHSSTGSTNLQFSRDWL